MPFATTLFEKTQISILTKTILTGRNKQDTMRPEQEEKVVGGWVGNRGTVERKTQKMEEEEEEEKKEETMEEKMEEEKM